MYIGIDLGTSSVKLLLMDSNKKVLKTVSKSYNIIYPKPSWSEQNPDDWWNAVIEKLCELISGNENNIRAISFSGQMHGMVAVDKNGQVIRNAILWNDQRTEKQCNYLNNAIGMDKLSKWVNNIALTGFTAPKVLWLKEKEQDNFNKINKILLPKDYIAYKLSGIYATDVSDASGTLYYDVANKMWSNEMLNILGIGEEKLPKVYESSKVIGNILPEIAKKIGVNKNVKIIIGGGDQAVGAIGTGTVKDGECTISLGTSGVIFVANDNFKVDNENALHAFAHANGKYHLMGVILSAASSLKWWVEDILRSNYAEVLEKVNITSIEDTIFFLPYLMGERTPINNPNAKGLFIGMGLHHSQQHMTRAILEGVVFAIRDSLEIMKKIGVNIREANVSGGGSKNLIWNQILSDALNLKINIIKAGEGPAFGAALLAMSGDTSTDINKLCSENIEIVNRLEPVMNNVNLYEQKYKKFKYLYPSVKGLF